MSVSTQKASSASDAKRKHFEEFVPNGSGDGSGDDYTKTKNGSIHCCMSSSHLLGTFCHTVTAGCCALAAL